ncbi:lysophospholipid acyltransferase family protein [Malikia sp.]|uniref:lysophospholipid acyltransferase family protein n=1 Tax=Malikia sp. TaxID=2070706 RepID=UPI002627FDFD|nr:lysophospholipid acyltransferase family protein [Malikia sp.]MDD2729229.1 lysophospholipid acyltransferase family protein [Malikia sp.]
MPTVFRSLAAWPLPLLHALGWLGGWLAWLASPSYRRRWAHNTRLAGLRGAARWASVGEAGKLSAELPRLWLGRPLPWRWDGIEHIEAARAAGQGMLFLTPHLGCFEIAAQAYAARFGTGADPKPMTVLYRPPRQAWLRALVEASRARPGLATAPTTLAGVRQLIQALRSGEAVGLLPDQVPPEGQGVWAPFFGQPAYTMTLSARFARLANTRVLLAWGERLSWGRGYVVHVLPLEELLAEPLADDAAAIAAQFNRAMERVILRCPQQYLWGYARYKQPRAPA